MAWGSAAHGPGAYEQSGWREASTWATEALRRDRADRGALRLLARASARLGNDSTAQNLFHRLGAWDAQAEDFLLLATTLSRQGDVSQALTMLERAHSADPDHAETLFQLSGLYARMDRLAEATDLAERLTHASGWEARAWARLGPLYDDQHDPARAVESLDRALRIDPLLRGADISPATARIRLARALLEVHRPAEARSRLEAVLVAGANREASWLLSRAALQQGDVALASAAHAAAAGYGDERPEAFEPSPFVGSARCAECHPEVHRAEQSGRHAHTFHPAGELLSIDWPDRPLPDPAAPGVSHAIRRQGAGSRSSRTCTARIWRPSSISSSARASTPRRRSAAIPRAGPASCG